MTESVDRPPIAVPIAEPDTGKLNAAWRVWADQMYRRVQDLEERLAAQESG